MNKKAFTLIELLIVVAIIGILAAIAVPNFMNAQMRAQLARVKADFRTIQTAFQSYRVDNNDYPEDNWGPCQDYNAYKRLTTPISYVSGLDVFKDYFTNESAAGAVGANCAYNYYDYGKQQYITQAGVGYVVISFGPDRDLDMGWNANSMNALRNSSENNPSFIYDSSNGVRASGDLILTEMGIHFE